jgi:hypothetical protein
MEKLLSYDPSEAHDQLRLGYHDAVDNWCIAVNRLCNARGLEFFRALADARRWRQQAEALRLKMARIEDNATLR